MTRSSLVNRSQLSEELNVISHVPGVHLFCTYRNLVLGYWMTEPQTDTMRALNDVCARVITQHKQGFSGIHVIRQGVGIPGSDARKALAAAQNRFGEHVACMAVILSGAGFWASALQSFITGVRLLAPVGNMQMRFLRDVRELSGWLVPEHHKRTGERVEEELLLRLIARLQERGDESAPAVVIG